jgi:4-alpha-glucanotransferase
VTSTDGDTEVSGDGGPHGPGTDRWGVGDGWWATTGEWVEIEPSTRRGLREAIGEPQESWCWFVDAGSTAGIWSPGTIEVDPDIPGGGGSITVVDHLPGDLPVGAHRLVSDNGHVTHLFVIPHRAPDIGRGWGWAAQLYGLRSERNWGHGDLFDLATLGRRCIDAGARVLAHNPLGPPVPVHPLQPSPYYPSSRRLGSPLYLAVERVPGAELLGSELERAASAGQALWQGGRIRHDEVWDLKLDALDRIWTALGRPDPVLSSEPIEARHGGGAAWVRACAVNARFNALAEAHGSGFDRWPGELRRIDSPPVHEACNELAERVAFWRWVFTQVDEQNAVAQDSGPGLLADLPVGFDPSGADAWADAELLALGWRIGAPPDDFAPQGQDWGLPPYVPWALRRAGYRPWLDTLRCAVRHASVLRIDHVMGLMRLYWIPEGGEASHGGYVYGFGAELLELAVMVAHTAGVALVGEDLGTVDPSVREVMDRRGVYGYRVGWFEEGSPAEWPERTVATPSTHDLPTLAGLWDGTDAADRRRAGLAADPEGDALLRRRMARLADIDPAASVEVDEVVRRVQAGMGDAGSDLAVANLEDAARQRSRPNLPGTVDAHPNWRQMLPIALEDLDLRCPFGDRGRPAEVS